LDRLEKKEVTSLDDSNETEAEPIKTEVKSITEDMIKFINMEPVDNVELTIFRLESIKSMLKTDKFDELLETARATKEARDSNQFDDEYEDYFEDDLPPHLYGSDGKVTFQDLNN
jgi:hypothetical protein